VKAVSVLVDISVDDDLSELASIPEGYRPVAILVPAVDSTVISFQAQHNGGTLTPVYTAVHGSAPAAYTLGTANTGGHVQPIPADLSYALMGANIKIVVSQQTSGDVPFVLWCERAMP